MNIFLFFAEGQDASEERFLLEHWQCTYTQKSNTILQGSDFKALFNKFVIMFRSVFMYLKVLPAYRVFRSLSPASSGKVVHQISPGVVTTAFPFGPTKPEKIDIGRLETPFGTIEMTVSYRKDVSRALADRPEVIPAESIIPDYAPSLSNRIPIRTSTMPVSIQTTGQRSSGIAVHHPAPPGGRQRANTGRGSGATAFERANRMEAHSQPSLIDHARLSFSPPVVGARSMWTESGPVPVARERQNSEPPFPSFNPSSVGAYSSSPRGMIGAYSASPRGQAAAAAAASIAEEQQLLFPRSSGTSGVSGGSAIDGDRVLTAVSPPSFSQYEIALHESPDPEFDGPVFSIEGSFAVDEESDVNSFVRFCQSKPSLLLIEDENKQMPKLERVFSIKN